MIRMMIILGSKEERALDVLSQTHKEEGELFTMGVLAVLRVVPYIVYTVGAEHFYQVDQLGLK